MEDPNAEYVKMTSLQRMLDFTSGADQPNLSFYCPDTLYEYSSSTTPHVPRCTVKLDELDHLEVQFDALASVSTVGEALRLPPKSIKNIVHDFTYGCFSESTDRPLSTIKVLGDSSDRFTPDEIIQLQDEALVIEYTTYRLDFTTERAARRIFNAKVDSYKEHLIARSTEMPIRFFIIITTPSSVWTNVPRVSQFWIDELCFRYRTAISLGYTIESTASINVFSSAEKDSKYKEVLTHLELTPLHVTSGLLSDELIQSFKDVNPDEDIVQQHVRKALSLGHKKFQADNLISETNLSNGERVGIRLKKIQEDFDSIAAKVEDGRLDLKACAQVPMVILDYINDSGATLCNDEFYNMSEAQASSHPVMRLFSEAFFKSANQESLFLDGDAAEVDLALLPDDERANKEDELKPHRMKYHRVVVDSLTLAEEEALACVGVNGKKWERESSSVQEYRTIRKRPFSMHVDTNDIDTFINSKDLFNSSCEIPYSVASRAGLIKIAYDLSQTKETTKEFLLNILDSYESSYLGRYLRMISLIATELDASLKQHCKSQQWIFKRIRSLPLYVIIKPTDSSKHIFFALAWPTDKEIWSSSSTVFKAIHRAGDWSCTDMISVSKSKLTNLVLAEARGLSISALSMEHSRVNLMEGDSIFKPMDSARLDRARRFTLLSILTMLHDKSCVDEALSEVRYLMLEGFKERPQFPNPGKKFSGLTHLIRSRMHAWVYKRLKVSAERIVSVGGFGSSVGKNGVDWSGLFDACTGDPLEDFQQLTNTFYYNYVKNKDEIAGPNTTIKLLEKILDYENKLPEEKDHLGKESNPSCEYKFLEFSPDLVKYCCQMAKGNLEKKLGRGWMTQLDNEIMQAIADIDLEDLSTLKASSSFTSKEGCDTQTRPRAATAMRNLWSESSDSYKAVQLMNHCLKKLHESGGLFIDLFKKNQHGGLREIYVLSAESRLIQAILEAISRTICKQFQSEIMTHPRYKLRAAGIHSSKTKATLKTAKVLTTCTSDDASKWNQGHYVTKFMIMLLSFTKPHLHNFIISALDLWLQKNIKIPSELLRMMDNVQLDNWLTNEYSSDVSKQLAKAYKSSSDVPWMESGSTYITTESGMMQGILHYTSSLYHTIVQETMAGLAGLFLNSKNLKSSITVLQSSDDSAMMISCPTELNSEVLKAYYYSNVVFYWKYELAAMMGIYKSDKSTTGTINVMEFNSEYFDHGSLIRPTAKWVFACQQIPESETLYGRQESFYNLASQILEGGGSIILTAICQLSQALLYYLMMGCGISPGWFQFVSSVHDMPDPSLGFFLLDDPLVAGMGTERFLLYMALKNSEILSKKYKIALVTRAQLVAQQRDKLEQLDAISGLLTTGSITESSLILYGDKKKWHRLTESLSLPDDWKEKLNNDPETLYRRARNSDEYELRLALKMHGPGVMASLSTGNVITRTVASSVYLLTRSVLSVKGSVLRKTNILRKLCDDKKLAAELSPLSLDEYGSLFPHYPSYESFIDTKSNVEMTGYVDQTRKRRTKADIVVFDAPVNESYSLEKVMMSIWFGAPFPTTTRYRDKLFEQYRRGIPWLSKSIQETLTQSPFEDQIQLRNFLSRQDMNDRVIHLNCAPVPGRKGKAILETVLYKNLWPNWIASTVIAEERQQISHEYEKLTQELFMISKMPVGGSMRGELSREVLDRAKLPEMPSDTSLTRNPMVSLYLIHRAVHDVGIKPKATKHAVNSEMVDRLYRWLELCSDMGTGVFGYFSTRQKFKNGRYQGRGIWVGKLDTSKVMIHIDSDERGTYLQKVYVTDSTKFMMNIPLLRSWCHDCNVDVRETKLNLRDEGTIAYRLNKKSYAPYKSSFPPVIRLDGLLIRDLNESYIDYHSLVLEQMGVSLRIVGEVHDPSTGGKRAPQYRRITILQCPVGILDSKLGMLDPDSLHLSKYMPFWSEWIARQRAPADLIMGLLDHPSFFEKGLGFESVEAAQKWMRGLFWETARIMGISDVYSEPVLHDDDMLCELDDFDLINFAMDADVSGVSYDDFTEVVETPDTSLDLNIDADDYDQLLAQIEFQESLSVISGGGPKDRIQRVFKPLLEDWVITEGRDEVSRFLKDGNTGGMSDAKVERLVWISGVEARKQEEYKSSVDLSSLLGMDWGGLNDATETTDSSDHLS